MALHCIACDLEHKRTKACPPRLIARRLQQVPAVRDLWV